MLGRPVMEIVNKALSIFNPTARDSMLAPACRAVLLQDVASCRPMSQVPDKHVSFQLMAEQKSAIRSAATHPASQLE